VDGDGGHGLAVFGAEQGGGAVEAVAEALAKRTAAAVFNRDLHGTGVHPIATNVIHVDMRDSF
jgi:hypothetical protein